MLTIANSHFYAVLRQSIEDNTLFFFESRFASHRMDTLNGLLHCSRSCYCRGACHDLVPCMSYGPGTRIVAIHDTGCHALCQGGDRNSLEIVSSQSAAHS